MTMKLVQKQFLKGRQEFEITQDAVHVRIKKLFKEEKLTLSLAAIDPEAVVNQSVVEFYGHDNAGPLLVLRLDEPSADEFSVFVATLRQRALEASGVGSEAGGIGMNVFDEPPEFSESETHASSKNRPPVDAARVDNDIRMLEQYLNAEDIKPLLVALEALKADPKNESIFFQMVNAFNDLGPMQGAVLTYAPYITVLLSYEVGGDQAWTR